MKIAIIVGRFQVPELTDGHIHLVRTAQHNSDKVIVFIGSRVVRSANDPLPVKLRKENMIKHLRLTDSVYELKDHKSNDIWFDRLSEKIKSVTNENDTITYFGSRDSFLDYLPDNLNKFYVEERFKTSGTSVRQDVSYSSDKNFQSGYIKAINDEFNAHFTVVDAIITDGTNVLLGRKDTGYCLIGGFADECDSSLEEAIIREVKEETNLDVTNPQYLMSHQCKDWRYSRARQPFSIVYTIKVDDFKDFKAMDDIDEIVIVPLTEVENYLLPTDSHLLYIKTYMGC